MAKTPKPRRKSTRATFIQRSRAVSSERKAIYHNVVGAGANGVIREFFGVSPDEQVAIGEQLGRLLTDRLGRIGS
jgi:hypothetical protein